MKQTVTMIMVLAMLAGGVALAEPPQFGRTAPTSVTQPTKLPGEWELCTEPMPDLAAIIARPAANPPVYGLYSWCGEYRTHRESIRKVGFRNIRIAGPVDDETVKMMAADGIEVMVTLGVYVTGEVRKRPDYDSDKAFIAANLKGIDTFLTRYGPGGTLFGENPSLPKRPIKAVEIWNEPNFQYMIPDREPRSEVEAEREALYAKLLPAVYKTVKAKWPGVTVVGFGAGGASAGDLRFIEHVHGLSPKVAASYDVLSTHPYARPVPPEAWSIKSWGHYATIDSNNKIRRTLAAHGVASKPIFWTEVGWPISKADGGRFPTRAGEPLASPLLQAAYICRTYALAMRLGAERVNIMFVTDSDGFNGGFFGRDGSWRPSAYAVQNMIRLMPKPKLVAAIHDNDDGLFAYVFETGAAATGPAKAKAIMAWNVAGPKTVSLPVGKIGMAPIHVTVVDMFGNATRVAVTDGAVEVEVGPCPIYITSGSTR